MSRHCTFCGSKLEDGAKICTNCGKMVPIASSTQRRGEQEFIDRSRIQGIPKRVYEHPKRAEAEERMRREQEARKAKRVRETDRNREMSAADYRRTPTDHSSSGKENYGKGKKILKTLLKITVVILVIYFVIAFVRIFSVRHSTYDFDTEMKLASENYGEAVDAYFKDGKWKYNIFKNQVSYEGTSESGDDYVMIFGKNDGQTVVRQMTKNSKKVASDSIMNDVMGMFMFEKKVTG